MVAVISFIQPRHCLSYIHLPHALLSSVKPYAARSFFPCVQTITAQFDHLYSQSIFQFQLFFSPVHFSVYVDYNYIYMNFSKVNKVKSPIWSDAPSGESTTTVRRRNYQLHAVMLSK